MSILLEMPAIIDKNLESKRDMYLNQSIITSLIGGLSGICYQESNGDTLLETVALGLAAVAGYQLYRGFKLDSLVNRSENPK